MIITRAVNVWIKFIPFINNMLKKRLFEVFGSTIKYMENVEVSVRISHL